MIPPWPCAGLTIRSRARALEHPGFGLVVEAGLGAGPEAFRSLVGAHLPGVAPRRGHLVEGYWRGAANVEDMPAYRAMKKAGADACGLTQLASRTVGVPFVGLIAGLVVIGELLRRLHGGIALEFAAGSVRRWRRWRRCRCGLNPTLSVMYRPRDKERARWVVLGKLGGCASPRSDRCEQLTIGSAGPADKDGAGLPGFDRHQVSAAYGGCRREIQRYAGDLDKERKFTGRQWAKRETQILSLPVIQFYCQDGRRSASDLRQAVPLPDKVKGV